MNETHRDGIGAVREADGDAAEQFAEDRRFVEADGDENEWSEEASADGVSLSPSANASETADLTRRVKSLTYVRPLFDLQSSLDGFSQTFGRSLDAIRVGLHVIREVGLQNTFGSGPTNAEMRTLLREVILEQWRDAPGEALVQGATVVLRALENRRAASIDKSFEVPLYDHETREVGSQRFKYLVLTRQAGSPDLRYQITDEAALVYGALADNDLDADLQSALHKLVEEAIAGGRVERAERLAEHARDLARRIALRISKLVSQLILNARSVTWIGDFQEPVSDARAHLDRRQVEQNRLRDVVSIKIAELVEIDDDTTIRRLGVFLSALDAERVDNDVLLRRLNKAHEQFLESQTRAFKFRRRSLLPEPRDVADDILNMSIVAVEEGFPEMTRHMAPLIKPRFFDLDRLIVGVAEQVKRDPLPDLIDYAGAEMRQQGPPVPQAVTDEARKLVEEALQVEEDVDLATILSHVDAHASNGLVRLVAAGVAYGYYDGSKAAKFDREARRIDNENFENDVVKGDMLSFSRRIER